MKQSQKFEDSFFVTKDTQWGINHNQLIIINNKTCNAHVHVSTLLGVQGAVKNQQQTKQNKEKQTQQN